MFLRNAPVDELGRQAVDKAVAEVGNEGCESRDECQQQEVQGFSSHGKENPKRQVQKALSFGRDIQVLRHPSANCVASSHARKPDKSCVDVKRDQVIFAFRATDDGNLWAVESIEEEWKTILQHEVANELCDEPRNHDGHPVQPALQGVQEDFAALAFAFHSHDLSWPFGVEDPDRNRQACRIVGIIDNHRHPEVFQHTEDCVVHKEPQGSSHDRKGLGVLP
mmetsp:Transcript_49852/g.117246  ORF Transcript_49852/g.117246 Transcript_49852/m.117246 type:complete len:222 (+) Transcript_49852:327-992(+)